MEKGGRIKESIVSEKILFGREQLCGRKGGKWKKASQKSGEEKVKGGLRRED